MKLNFLKVRNAISAIILLTLSDLLENNFKNRFNQLMLLTTQTIRIFKNIKFQMCLKIFTENFIV